MNRWARCFLHRTVWKLTQQDFTCQKGASLELAVDVGCGSGQGTVLLAQHFGSVVGTDVSAAQLEEAVRHASQPNISYRWV